MPQGRFSLQIVSNEKELGRIGSGLFMECAREAIQERSRFSVVLSGGKTPRALYEALVADGSKYELPWEKTHFFWGDERDVPPEHPESNFHAAWVALISRDKVPAVNVHRIRTELKNPQAVAKDYENTIRSFFGLKAPSEKPRFDLVYLGLGTDGHTASLFPGAQPGVDAGGTDPDQLVVAPWVPQLKAFRISLTLNSLNHSNQVVFLVSGGEKAAILAKVLEDRASNSAYPANAIEPVEGRLTWLIEKQAASLLAADRYVRPSPCQSGT
jgi:6-phosphogluconolactonase